MNALFAAAAEIQDHLRRTGERFCFIGGVALQRWGEPRLTRDVDLTLLCPYGAESATAERLLAGFSPRMPDARDWADIESIAIRQSRRMDWTLIYRELTPLAELRGGAETMNRLRRLQPSFK